MRPTGVVLTPDLVGRRPGVELGGGEHGWYRSAFDAAGEKLKETWDSHGPGDDPSTMVNAGFLVGVTAGLPVPIDTHRSGLDMENGD
jgi:hypothetical protein